MNRSYVPSQERMWTARDGTSYRIFLRTRPIRLRRLTQAVLCFEDSSRPDIPGKSRIVPDGFNLTQATDGTLNAILGRL